MEKVLTAEEIREIDRLTTEKYGVPSILLMENAAHATSRVIAEKLGGSVKDKSFLILCGKGNNGGDAAAIARILSFQRAEVEMLVFGKVEDTRGDARINFDISTDEIVDSVYEINSREEWDEFLFSKSDQGWDAVVDGIFGTGLTRPLDVWLGNVVHHINILGEAQDRLCISIDLPSGLCADSSGLIGEAFRADVTVTFTAPKIANVLAPASGFNGELVVVDIGSPDALTCDSSSQTFISDKHDARGWLLDTDFSNDSYKNKRGNALLIVGSKKYAGAAVLAGNGAMQSGVGLVTVVTPDSALNAVSERIVPEVMVRAVSETPGGAISEAAFEELTELREKADVIAIGSGLDTSEETTIKLVSRVVRSRITPVVIDADGLNALSPFDLKGASEYPLILTPHEGEFLRLIGTEDRARIEDRVGAVREFARKHQVILVLKGERTLIAEPGGTVVINPTGNSGLGKAGNGDNLTGIITGFIAQAVQAKVDIFETVVAAVYIAGLAADTAEKKFGKRVMLASDVRDCLVEAFREVKSIDD